MEESFSFIVKEDAPKGRSDKVLSALLPDFSRSRLQALMDQGCVLINNTIKPASYKLKPGDHVVIQIPPLEEATPQAVSMDLCVLYEDPYLLVINKPSGLVVHPAPGHSQDTLVNGLLFHCQEDLSGIGGVKRPGIVHRLDKDTSGLMVVAKNDAAHQGLSLQFHDRTLSRQYYALVYGLPSPSSGKIEGAIGRCPHNRQKMALRPNGKPAVTNYKVLKTFLNGSISLVSCKLETGRTHQIRVHLTSIGYPIVGDPLYGNTPKSLKKGLPLEVLNFPRQALHAYELTFLHPISGEKMTFTCELSLDLKELQEILELERKSF